MHKVFQQTIDQITQESGLTGGAFAIFEDGKVSVKECFGIADIETGRKITEESMFDIASNSKAFTTMLGAIAQDEGKFGWDVPVCSYMPSFTMLDKYIGEHMTGRDMASHRTGMPRHDFMRTKVRGSRCDTVERSFHMEFTKGFREGYQYNNQMYIDLGYIFELIYGKTWEQLVEEKIAKPLNMEMRFRGPSCDLSGLDCALPYMTDGKRPFRTEYANSPTSGPCGGIRTNLRSMINWVSAMLKRGSFGDFKLCSENAFAELVRPAIVVHNDTEKEMGNAYALAWHTCVYNGHHVIFHGGDIDGFNSEVAFLPYENKAFVLMVNTNATPAPDVIREMFLDYLTGGLEGDYSKNRHMLKWIEDRDSIMGTIEQSRKSTPLSAEEERIYCGEFYHPAYDEFTITKREDGIWFDYGGFHAKLGRFADGIVKGYEDSITPSFVQLKPESDGSLRMNNADSELWLHFKRVK